MTKHLPGRHPNSVRALREHGARSQFPKGWQGGNKFKRQNFALPAGEWLDKTGYVKIYNEHGRIVCKHRHLWEKENGAIPPRHCVISLGNRYDFDMTKWTLVPIEFLTPLQKMGYFASDDPELRKAMLATVKIRYAIRKRERE